MSNNAENRVFFISLGCAKNLVDSEHMLGLLSTGGYEIAQEIEDAAIAVINTCAFIQDAVEETIDAILEMADLRKQGKLNRLIVAGCFVQRYGYRLRDEIPEVDGWLGTGDVNRVVDVIKEEGEESSSFYISRPDYLADHSTPRVQSTPFFSAYLKIAEGCSHRCTYCIIPKLRGRLRSRKPESLIVEAEQMVDLGVKEINLIAQDPTLYGTDLNRNICLEDLLELLAGINGIHWIRLLYCHPAGITDRLLELLESEPTICPYLDLPFQHVDKSILKAMDRGLRQETPWELLDRIRSRNFSISLRTTLMVGFPGETQQMYQKLYDFVKTARFEHLGVFVFSPEKGTPAARFEGAVPRELALERQAALMALQSEISETLNQRLVGQIVPVLIEGPSPETELLLKGRTAAMAPEVDTRVLINNGEGIIGEIMPVLIREAHPYDIIGEIDTKGSK